MIDPGQHAGTTAMSNPPVERKVNDSRQNSDETPPIAEVRTEQETTAKPADTGYRFVNKATGAEFPINQVYHEALEVTFGDVVEIQAPNSKPDYFSVDSVEEGEIATVYLVRARNSLWKSILLLAILGAGWFIIDYVLKLIS